MLILICGGSCSGKSTLASSFKSATIVSMDDFYVGKSKMKEPYNFDEPSAVDLEYLYKCASKMSLGEQANVPIYDMVSSERVGYQDVYPKEIVIIEGIFVLKEKRLRDLADLKIYLDVKTGERIARRIERDVQKGRTPAETLQFSINVEKMHEIHVESQKQYADVVIKD